MSGLHVYAVFDESSGELIAINASIAGAGVAAIGHVGSGFVQDDGRPVDLEAMDAFLAVEAAIYLRKWTDKEASIRIERRFLGP